MKRNSRERQPRLKMRPRVINCAAMNYDIPKLKDSIAKLTESTRPRIERNKRHLRDLFTAGRPFPGHAFLCTHPAVCAPPELGDYSLSTRPVADWLPYLVADYEAQLKWLEVLDHDCVPFVSLLTHTAPFAAAFGSKLHQFENSNAAATPCISTVAEAEKLKVPDIYKSPTLARCLELASLVRDTLGPEVSILACDLQSPFGIAAQIWKKQEMLVAMIEEPDAVKCLIEKTHETAKKFFLLFRSEHPNYNPVLCPRGWAPNDLGCGLSEDEIGMISNDMFEEFSLPKLIDLSETFGGLFMHCCAAADRHYASFEKIPNFRGIHRIFQKPPGPGPMPAFKQFAGKIVFLTASTEVEEHLGMAQPGGRYMCSLNNMPLDEIRRWLDSLRVRYPRRIS